MNRTFFFPSVVSSMFRDFDDHTRDRQSAVSSIFRDFDFGEVRNRQNYSIVEDENAYNIEIDLPGFKKENIEMGIKDEILTITAEKKRADKEDNSKEVVVSRFEERFSVNSGNADLEKIEAKLEDGVLTVSIPKKEETKYEKKVEIR